MFRLGPPPNLARVRGEPEERERAGDELAVSLRAGTLQGLVGVRMLLKSGLSVSQSDALPAAAEQAIHQLEYEIAELRGLIAEIRSRPDSVAPAPTDVTAPSP